MNKILIDFMEKAKKKPNALQSSIETTLIEDMMAMVIKSKVEDAKKCPLCKNKFHYKDGIQISFNGLCKDCAKSTYDVWELIVR